ncbi:MAG: hypothetical protein CVU11_13640 [Bacteroidetes bacterium HGW-Bacteroidetes-6]|jgi:glycosyltransferase involved in cell wall biosynthesis|nr:MAG: hypothetical protein CVU11_13640 [Bacteroidetes bacterium HGW-Bacteroidetes-6]
MNKPHILFLPAWFPDDHDPMFGLFVKKHAETLLQHYQVSVLHVTYHADTPNRIVTRVTNGIYVTNVNIRTNIKLLKWISFFVATYKAYKIIKQNQGKPSVNHVHILTRMGVLAAFIRLRFGVPYVITEHWSRYFPVPGTYRNIIRKTLTRYICKRAEKLSTVSRGLAEAMQKHNIGNNRPYSIINNVVDELVFSPPNLRVPTYETIRFINVSCFEDRSKNLTGLVDIAAVLVTKGIKFECVLAGTGQDFLNIKEYIKHKGLEKYCILPGLLNEYQVAELMRSCHFYIQPSHFENVPVVISEALMCGLPVVATRVGSVEELINTSNGYLVDAANPTALQSAVELMIDNFASFDSALIRKNAMARFSKAAVLKQFNELYSDLI